MCLTCQELMNASGRNPEKGLILEFFFHGRGTPEQKTSLGMFRSLLWQLCNKEPSVSLLVASIFAEKTATQGKVKDDWDWHVEEVKRIFTHCLGKVAAERNLMLFVDALDEAGTEEAKDLAKYFNSLTSELHSKRGIAKICISCRHYPVITIKVSLDIYVEQENYDDIKAYVGNNLDACSQVLETQFAPGDINSLSTMISNRAVGIFQWAKLTVRLVSGLIEDGESLATINQRLKTVPPGLLDVYDHILREVIRPENLLRTLLLVQWIVFAERPLSVKELHWATACDNNGLANSENEPFSADVIHNIKLINSLSGGLIEADARGTYVQFIHGSVKDYMQDAGLAYLLEEYHRSAEGIQPFSGSKEDAIGESQARLARACIGCLRRSYPFFPRGLGPLVPFSTLRKWEADNAFPRHHTQHVRGSTNSLDHPHLLFLEYAESYWFCHSRKAELAENDNQRLDVRFLRPPKGRKSVLEIWKSRVRLVVHNLTFRRLFGDLLNVQKSQTLSSTIVLLIDNRVCFEHLANYPNGVTENEMSKWGPIHHAASWGHVNLVQALLKAGRDKTNFTISTALDAVDIAAMYKHKYVLRILLGHRSHQPHDDTRTQSDARRQPMYSQSSLESIINYLMVWGAGIVLPKDVDDKEDPLRFSTTALRKAVRDGNLMMVEQLLDWGFEDVRIGVCGTLLSDTIETPGGKGPSIMQLLLDYGADPARTPHCKSCCCNWESELLDIDDIDNGMCKTWINIRPGQYGNSVSIIASKGDAYKALMATLVNHLNGQWSETLAEDTILHAAVRGSPRAAKIIRMLIKKLGVDVNAFIHVTFEEANRSEEGTGQEEDYCQTVLQAAVGFGDDGYDNVKTLLKKGAYINCFNPNPDPNPDPDDAYVQVVGGHTSFCEEEFDEKLKKATSQETDRQRDWGQDVVWVRTALTSAAALGDKAKSIVQLLLRKGADPHLRRRIDCLTPLQIAESLPSNNEIVVGMLRKAMSDPQSFIDEDDSDGEVSSSSSEENETQTQRYTLRQPERSRKQRTPRRKQLRPRPDEDSDMDWERTPNLL